MTGDLDAILDYVDALRELDTTGVEPMTHAVPFDCPLRPDQVAPSLPIDSALANAPRREASFFQVPRIVPGPGGASGSEGKGKTSRDRRARREPGVDRRRGPRGRFGARDVTEQFLDRVARLDGGAGLLPAGRRRGRAPPGRRRRRRPQGGARSRAAGRRAARHQGHLLHAGDRDHLRLEDPARVRAAVRVDGHGAAGGGRRGGARQAQHGRVRHGLVEREQRGQADAQPLVDGARAGRLVGRLGGGGRGVAVRGRDRHRHRRLDPPAGRALRRRRHEADLRPRLALRRHRLRLVARSPGAVRAHRRGRGGAAGGHGRRRSARRDLDPGAGRRLPAGRARRARGARRACASACRTNTFSPAWTPRSRPPCAPRSTSSGARGPSSSRSRCRTPSTPSRPTTSSAPPRRRRTWRATTACATATAPPTRSSLEELYARTRGEGFGAEPKRRIMLGTYVLRAGYYEAYYGKALRARRKIADDFTAAFAAVRRHRDADLADAGVQVRRAHGRPAADVPGRRLHRRAEPGRHPGAVAALRVHQGRAADRPADHRPAAGRGDLLPRRRRLRGAHRLAQAAAARRRRWRDGASRPGKTD